MPDDAPFLLDVTRLIWRRWKGRRPTGIDRVCLAYVRHFGGRAQAVVQHDRFRRILDRAASEDLFALLAEPLSGFKPKLATGLLRHLGHWQTRGGAGRPYLNVGHTGLDSPGLRHWAREADVAPVYLVHDLIPITHPQFCRPGEAARHRERMLTVLQTANRVIANSRSTLDELARFASAERMPMPPALPALLGSDRLPVTPNASAPKRPTFVALGTIEGRKNHLLLLEIWSRLIDRLGSGAPRLLIIGQRGWQAEPVFAALASGKLRGHVIELGDCSDRELSAHLAGARALLFPSFAEGYGLPLVEALGAGVPAIASDLPVFRELCGAMPDYLGPGDATGWESAILDYAAADSASRAAQLARIAGFRPPTWEAHFSAVEAWLSSPGGRAST